MARKKVEAPTARIQRNLLTPVDTFYQSKTGVVVQPGDKSRGLQLLEKSLNLASRKNEKRIAEWEREQEILGRKMATMDIAKNKNEMRLAREAHPEKSKAWQIGYNATAGEASAISWTAEIRREYLSKRNGTRDAQGNWQPFDAKGWLQWKIANYSRSLKGNPYYIGGASKHLNQFTAQMYAEDAQYSKQLHLAENMRSYNVIITNTLESPSHSDTQKILNTHVYTERMVAMGTNPRVARENWIKQIIGTNDIDVIERLMTMSETGRLLRRDQMPVKLTPEEIASLDEAVRSIKLREAQNQKLNEWQYSTARQKARTFMFGEILPQFTTEKMMQDPREVWEFFKRTARKNRFSLYYKDIYGMQRPLITQAEFMEVLKKQGDLYRSLEENSDRDNRNDATKLADFQAFVTALQSSPESAYELLGTHAKTTADYTKWLPIARQAANRKSWFQMSHPDDFAKAFGKDIQGKATVDGARMANAMTEFFVNLDKNDGEYTEDGTTRKFDVTNPKDRAEAFALARLYALQNELTNNPNGELSNISKGKEYWLAVTRRKPEDWDKVDPLTRVSPSAAFAMMVDVDPSLKKNETSAVPPPKTSDKTSGKKLKSLAEMRKLAAKKNKGNNVTTANQPETTNLNALRLDQIQQVVTPKTVTKKRHGARVVTDVTPESITFEGLTLSEDQLRGASELIMSLVPTGPQPIHGRKRGVTAKDMDRALAKFFDIDPERIKGSGKVLQEVKKQVLEYIKSLQRGG